MKVAIFGATGPTGLALTRQALEAGHEVTVLARNPARMKLEHSRLSIIHGDALDPMKVKETIDGSEAVLSCLGVKPFAEKATQSRAGSNIIRAMRELRVRRLIVETAYGVGESRALASVGMRAVFRLLLSWTYNDKEIEEREIKASGLDWTIVRPTALRSGPLTGKYRVGEDLRLSIGAGINRADVADFMLRQLSSSEWLRRAPTITE